jgi:hypothetical protein
MTFERKHLIGVRVRIRSSAEALDPGNGVGTIVGEQHRLARMMNGGRVFVRIDRPGTRWNEEYEVEYGRGWWYRMESLEMLAEEP